MDNSLRARPKFATQAIHKAQGMLLMLALALIFLFLLAMLLSDTPWQTLYYLFVGPLQSRYDLGNLINAAVPLLLGGLGVSLAMQGGAFNLGGEGQIYAGAFVSTIVSVALGNLGVMGGVFGICCGVTTAALLSALSGILRLKWETNELITTFLLSNATILVINYLVGGPFADPQTNLIATRKIPEALRLTRILEPSNLNTSLLFALTFVVLVHLYLYHSRSGYELRMYGLNRKFAIYGGINANVYEIWPLFLSGAFYGLAGSLAVFGTYFTTFKEFSTGMGWNGVAVALIARFKPSAAIAAALFFAYIEAGSRSAMLHSDVTLEISSIVQATVFLLVTSEVLQQIGTKRRSRA